MEAAVRVVAALALVVLTEAAAGEGGCAVEGIEEVAEVMAEGAEGLVTAIGVGMQAAEM